MIAVLCSALRAVWLASALLLLPAVLRGALVLEIGQNFTGSRYGTDSLREPADANGAVGPNHFVELINGRFSVYDKATGSRVVTMTDLAFWTGAGVAFPAGWTLTNPRLVFDAVSQRWFASMADYDLNSSLLSSNRFLLGVSASTDPTGPWQAFAFGGDPVHGYFTDYPTLGLDERGVYLSAVMFSPFALAKGLTFVALPKADLLRDPPTAERRTTFGLLSFQTYGSVPHPAVALSPTSNGEVLLSAAVGTDYRPHSNLVATLVMNGDMPGAASLSAPVSRDVPAYHVPLNPVQPGGIDTLDDGDGRFTSQIYRVGDVLYAVHGTQLGTRAALQWFKLDARDLTVIQTGIISHPELDLFYPSIAANSAGTLVIACNGCSPTTYISSFAILGETRAGVVQFGELTLLQAGTATYESLRGEAVSRWGDYSATSPDPADPNRFWTIQMIAAGETTWATQITELIASPLQLSVGPGPDGTIVVAWTSAASGFELRRAADPVGGDWVPVPQPPALVGNRFVVTLPAAEAGALGFLRLEKP